MSWTRLTSITTNNGSNIIAVNSGSTTNIKVGDALLVEGFDLVEIEGVFANQLQINSPWDAPTQSNISAAVLPTFGDFNNAVEEIRKLRQVTTDNLDAMEKWWTQSNGTVAFQSYNGDTFEVRTAQEMDSSVKQIEEAGLESIAEIESQAQALMTDVTSFSYARTEADMEADREAAKRVFAGSGMIHAGLGHANGNDIYAVNEGLYTFTSARNAFFAGRDLSATSNYVGTSETEFPVFNLNGVAVAVKGLNTVPAESPSHARFILPPAPRGTEVYDSSTGVVIDYATEVDPKYGDVAANNNEAVTRAFEGLIKNSDGRFGTVDFVVRDCTHAALPNGGGFTITPNVNTQYFEQAITCVIGTKYKAKAVFSVSTEVKGTESSPFCSLTILNSAKNASIAASTVELGEADKVYTFDVEFTATETTHFVSCFFNMPVGVGATATVNFVSADLSSREVVTHPADLVGFEWFLRPINAADPILYPNGIQQCKLTSVDGIATVENTFRPLTHFEVYPGDTTSRGRGFNILNGSLTDAQLKQQFQKKSNNVCRMSDGTIAQWTLSQRTFRGLGNGDWGNVNATSDGTLNFANQSRGKPRGNLDTPEYFGVGSTNDYLGSLHSISPKNHTGIFKLNPNAASNYAINGECYLYVVATVPRLNQGAYHPTLNPYGTCYLLRDTPGSQAGMNWYGSPDLREPLVTKNCFITAVYTDSTGYVRRDISGFIGSQVGSARPDGKFFDGIYADGLNGIIDWRKPAYPVDTIEDGSKVLSKVITGQYRGSSKLIKTRILRPSDFGSPINSFTKSGSAVVDSTPSLGAYGYRIAVPITTTTVTAVSLYGYLSLSQKSRVVYVGDNGGVFVAYGVVHMAYSGTTHYFSALTSDSSAERDAFNATFPNGTVINVYAMDMQETDVSVSGSYQQTEVVGRPDILIDLIPEFEGVWGGLQVTSPYKLTYPVIGASSGTAVSRRYYSNNGGAWSTQTDVAVNNQNTVSLSYTSTDVVMFQYSVKASMVEQSSILQVLGGKRGVIGMVFSQAASDTLGKDITFNLLGKVPTSTGSVNFMHGEVYQLMLFETGGLPTNSWVPANAPKHFDVPLTAPTGNSPAIKALVYLTSINGELYLTFSWNELKYGVSGWNDAGAIIPSAILGTYTNDVSERLRLGTHRLKIPYGFSKNRARPGTQITGVDL